MSAAFEITGLNALIDDVERQKLRVLGKITAGVRAVSAAVLTDVVKATPQYSGNLVLNWRIVFGPWTANYQPAPTYGVHSPAPYSRGQDPAVSEALSNELFKLDSARWNSKIKIVNAAPYAGEVEAGIGPNGHPIRDMNWITLSFRKL
jgi:hypothetical protein